ncbi:MAG TPA: hypothetical protein VH325_18490 [Bryobacteraceae bacterium]|jgi:hypothetical protein|nr:hypothetical protein [Bryobacteraceae bacterium]
MKRALWLSNVLLVLLIAASVWFIHRRNVEAKAAEARFLNAKAKPPVLLVFTAKPPAPVTAQAYVDNTVQKFVFARDRNPNVIEKPSGPPPPEPPMPPLPALYGLFLMGERPTIFLGVGGAPQRGYGAGDKVGEFTLVAFDDKTVTLTWNQKEVKRTLDQLAQNQAVAPPSAAAAAQVAAAAPPPVPPGENNGKPGGDIGGTSRACLAGDDSPTGTVSPDGYTKQIRTTPFGSACRWSK